MASAASLKAGTHQQEGWDVGVDCPQHRDQQRGPDFSARDQLPDANGDGGRQQNERDAVQPDVTRRAILQPALALRGRLEGLHSQHGRQSPHAPGHQYSRPLGGASCSSGHGEALDALFVFHALRHDIGHGSSPDRPCSEASPSLSSSRISA